VARLILLNGPSGIGKSTLAQVYVDEHPGALNLDVDRVRCLVGGWRDDFGRAGELVRPIAVSMIDTHLRAGHDVVMPQYLGRLDELEHFELAARRAGAGFAEVVLLDDRASAVDRFGVRGGDADPWHEEVRRLVERAGGRVHLEEMYDDLVELVSRRPDTILVPSEHGAVRQTYDRLMRALQAREGRVGRRRAYRIAPGE
jgi:predicted kinase